MPIDAIRPSYLPPPVPARMPVGPAGPALAKDVLAIAKPQPALPQAARDKAATRFTGAVVSGSTGAGLMVGACLAMAALPTAAFWGLFAGGFALVGAGAWLLCGGIEAVAAGRAKAR